MTQRKDNLLRELKRQIRELKRKGWTDSRIESYKRGWSALDRRET